MKLLSKYSHVCAILELYKAGYITVAERDKLVAELYKEFTNADQKLQLDIKVEGRDISYCYYRYSDNNTVRLFVKGDFYIKYDVKKDLFTVIELT